jgi:hypothetical protein
MWSKRARPVSTVMLARARALRVVVCDGIRFLQLAYTTLEVDYY